MRLLPLSLGSAGLVLGVATAGCSAGDDVYVPTGATRSELACSLVPGEDVCERTWDQLDPARRDAALAFLDGVSAFSYGALTLVAGLARTCEDALYELGVPAPSVPSGAGPAARAETMCNAASAAITERRSTPFTFQVAPGSCAALPARACISSSTPRERCGAPDVDVVLGEDAPASDRELAAKLSRTFVGVFAADAELRRSVEPSSAIARSISATDGMPDCLVSTASNLVRDAVDDMTTSTNLLNALVLAIGS